MKLVLIKMTSLSEKTDKSLKKFDYYPLVSADNDSVLVGQLLSLLVGVKCKTKRIKMSGSNAMSCTARVYVAGKVWDFYKDLKQSLEEIEYSQP